MFLEIFAISRNIELPENIAYLGPEGSFTHQAAESRFGAMSSYIPIGSIKGVLEKLIQKSEIWCYSNRKFIKWNSY